MGLHMAMVPLAKLHFTGHSLSPAVAGIVCPVALKLMLGLRFFREEAVYAARLFLFRLGQIAFNANGARLERALRLLSQTVTSTTAGTTTQSEDSVPETETFHALSMLTL